ncbi:MAG: hypothetical protein AB8G99_01910 [Planctomycetaceae bacterium]
MSSSSSSNSASLGCGTLILIALIVLFFGNNNDELTNQVRSLRADVKALSSEVQELRETMAGDVEESLPAEQPEGQ